MVSILRLKSFFCISIFLFLVLLSGCAHNQPGATSKPGLFDNLVNTFNPFSSQKKKTQPIRKPVPYFPINEPEIVNPSTGSFSNPGKSNFTLKSASISVSELIFSFNSHSSTTQCSAK